MSEQILQLPDGQTLKLDEKGYLVDFSQWTPAVADTMAAADGLTLATEHWFVIGLFQDYFKRFDIEPPMRWLVRQCQQEWGAEGGNSRALYRLFPDGPPTQACRYAGLPRPVSCI